MPDFEREISNQVCENKPNKSDYEHFKPIYKYIGHLKIDDLQAHVVDWLFLKKKCCGGGGIFTKSTQILNGGLWHNMFSEGGGLRLCGQLIIIINLGVLAMKMFENNWFKQH